MLIIAVTNALVLLGLVGTTLLDDHVSKEFSPSDAAFVRNPLNRNDAGCHHLIEPPSNVGVQPNTASSMQTGMPRLEDQQKG